MAYPYDMTSGGYGYSYSGPSGGFQPPQPVYGGGYGGGYGSFTPQAQTQYAYGGGSGGLGELESMLMSQFKRQSQNQQRDDVERQNNMNHWGSPFAPVRMPSAGQVGGRANWVAGQLEGQNYAQQLKATQGGGSSGGGFSSGSGGGGGGAGIGDLISLYGLRQQGANSAADRALASQKMQAELQIAREQNAMSQWATYMDMQNAEQNRLAQMEQQRRGFLDNAYGRADNAYFEYGI
jgi:hypothetical protein